MSWITSYLKIFEDASVKVGLAGEILKDENDSFGIIALHPITETEISAPARLYITSIPGERGLDLFFAKGIYESKGLPWIYMTRFISKEFGEHLQKEGLNYIDYQGNCFLNLEDPKKKKSYLVSYRSTFEDTLAKKYELSGFNAKSVQSFRVLKKLALSYPAFWKIQPLSLACNVSIGQIAKVKDFLRANHYLEENRQGFRLAISHDFYRVWAKQYRETNPEWEICRYFTPKPQEELIKSCQGIPNLALASFSAANAYHFAIRTPFSYFCVAPSSLKQLEEAGQLSNENYGPNVFVYLVRDSDVFSSLEVKKGPLPLLDPVQLVLQLYGIDTRGDEAVEAILKEELHVEA
jgi:hypothetical protein